MTKMKIAGKDHKRRDETFQNSFLDFYILVDFSECYY